MKASELVKGNTYLLTDKYFLKVQEQYIKVTFIECLSDGTLRFSVVRDGQEYTFSCGSVFVEKSIIEKETVFISWEIAHENVELSDYMDASGVEDILQWFEGDPDQLRIDGETVSFIDIPVSPNVEVVVYVDGSYTIDEKEIVNRLTQFYANECPSIESTSENMKNMQNGICYRGSKGYAYSLYQFPN